jgi:hydroxylysine kinase
MSSAADPLGRPASSVIHYGVRPADRRGARIQAAAAQGVVARHWGIVAIATPLPGEVDDNFHLLSADGEFLLKVGPSGEPRDLTDLVVQALLHVERSTQDVSAQRIVPTAVGEPMVELEDGGGDLHRVWMTTFAEGVVLRSIDVDDTVRGGLGSTSARLALALKDFDHPAAERDLSWDLRHAGRMSAMVDELPMSEDRRAFSAALRAFEVDVAPRLDSLPAQVVHNDLSLDNLVLAPDGRLVVIDFGDVVHTQRINDLAVAMADHLGQGPDPFLAALDVLRGYLAVEALTPDELSLLHVLVRTRVITRIVGGEWRAARFPENRVYLTRNVDALKALLKQMSPTPSTREADRMAMLLEEKG